MLVEVGRMCVKIAGRDSGRKCVVVDVVDDKTVLIDGDVRRKKVSVRHLEFLKDVIKISKGASHSDVEKEFKKLKLPVWTKKSKKVAGKPKRVRKKKEVVEKPKKEKKKEPKAAEAEKNEEPKKETPKEEPAPKKEEPKPEAKPAEKKE